MMRLLLNFFAINLLVFIFYGIDRYKDKHNH